MVHIGIAQAALGTVLSVDTLEDPEQIAIESGTQSGAVLRRKGLGVPHLRARGRGDLYIHVQIDTPTDLSDREVELLGELALIRGEHIEPTDGQRGIMSKIRSAFS
jgi:molecular chaperone DnaJ